MALAGKQLEHLPYRTWVLCGDSEMAEGSMWEAVAQASYDKLDKLTAIIDVNRLGQTGDGVELSIEESLWVDGQGRPQPIQQIVIQGMTPRSGGSFAWLFKKMG